MLVFVCYLFVSGSLTVYRFDVDLCCNLINIFLFSSAYELCILIKVDRTGLLCLSKNSAIYSIINCF